MEKQVDFLTKKIVELEYEGNIIDALRDYMRMNIDELKSQADRMASLEKQIAQVIAVDEENIKVGGTD
jgi:hypothetical protein